MFPELENREDFPKATKMYQKCTRNGPEMGPKSDQQWAPFREQKSAKPFEFLVFLQLSPPKGGPKINEKTAVGPQKNAIMRKAQK